MNLSENFEEEIFSENFTRIGDLKNYSTGCDEFCQEYSEKNAKFTFSIYYVKHKENFFGILIFTALLLSYKCILKIA